MTARRERPLDLLFACGGAELLEARDLTLRPWLVPELGEREASPQCERLLRSTFGHQRLEAGRVELVGLEPERIPRWTRGDPVLTQLLSQLRDVDLQGSLRGLRRPVAPERVDQPLARQDLVRVQQEDGEERARLAAQGEGPSVGHDLEWPEDLEVECHFPARLWHSWARPPTRLWRFFRRSLAFLQSRRV